MEKAPQGTQKALKNSTQKEKKNTVYPPKTKPGRSICVYVSSLSVLPVGRHEEEKDGEDFQPADEHIGTHQPLAGRRNHSKRAGRTGETGARTNVAQHADAAAQSGIDVCSEQRVAGHGYHHKQYVYEDERQSLAHLVVGHNLLSYTNTQNGSGMEHENQFVEDTLGADDDANNLYAACRTAGTSTNSHDDHRRHPE